MQGWPSGREEEEREEGTVCVSVCVRGLSVCPLQKRMSRPRCRLRRGLVRAKEAMCKVGLGSPNEKWHFWVHTWAPLAHTGDGRGEREFVLCARKKKKTVRRLWMYVRLSLADLRTEVVRRADHSVRLVAGVRQNARDAEVADLEYAGRRQKHVGRLQVCARARRIHGVTVTQFLSSQSKQWVDGSWVNGSVFWMGRMGHGSMHFHPWPTCVFANDILVHLMHAISLHRSETCSFLKLSRLSQLC